MIGLGTMGRNLLLNLADHGYHVLGFDQDPTKVQLLNNSSSAAGSVKGVGDVQEMIRLLETPRKIMMLVPAGKPVDAVTDELLPLLAPGDILIDGGNSFYCDTQRRIEKCAAQQIHFMGIGISGGEKGARYGPSIMPGGDEAAYEALKPMLEAVAAKVNGSPCVAYLGKGAAGHFVKMVHNGIEYAIMQMISETYWIFRDALKLQPEALHEIYHRWNQGPMQSFLLEITAKIFQQKDSFSDHWLIDMIDDHAEAKGTGKWTSQQAMDLHVPVNVIDTAVAMRDLSGFAEERKRAAGLYHPDRRRLSDSSLVAEHLHDALYFGTIVCYAQGLAMLHRGSHELDMQIPLYEVVRIWRGGCIIRSALLDRFYTIYQQDPELPNLLLHPEIADLLMKLEHNTRQILSIALLGGYTLPGLVSALSYFDAYRSERLPANLIQAQRDFFGAHTYRRIDREGIFHTEWEDANT
ncbi:MAG: NADP-dependent phosphogluconate dehydrogenase [Thermoflavifilum sp.]|nr:NADP-dependent phosphogluconate dehydrogenase [Thermoflavifilum sp.]